MFAETEAAPAAEPPAVGFSNCQTKLRKRDYWLLPLLSVSTACILFVAAEIGSRIAWPEYSDQNCFLKDPVTGSNRGKPYCITTMKNPEGPPVTYQFNECGYRTSAPCGPKAPGHLRIVLLGSSTSLGENIPAAETFGERAASALSRATGRTVELENLGFEGLFPLPSYRRLTEALRLEPDLVIFPVTPVDLEAAIEPQQLAARNDLLPPLVQTGSNPRPSPMKWLRDELLASRAVVMAEHFLFSNTEIYLRVYLNYGDKADILRAPLSPAWRKRFDDLDVIVGDMSARLHKAGVPLIVMAVPLHSEVALATGSKRPPHTDPFTFSREVGAIAARHQVLFVNSMDEFRRVRKSENFFYIVDGHLNSAGQGLLADALVRKCLDGSVPAFQPGSSKHDLAY